MLLSTTNNLRVNFRIAQTRNIDDFEIYAKKELLSICLSISSFLLKTKFTRIPEGGYLWMETESTKVMFLVC